MVAGLPVCSHEPTTSGGSPWPDGIQGRLAYVTHDSIFVTTAADQAPRLIASVAPGQERRSLQLAWAPSGDTIAANWYLPFGVGSRTSLTFFGLPRYPVRLESVTTMGYPLWPMYTPDGTVGMCDYVGQTYGIVVGGALLAPCSGSFDLSRNGMLITSRVLAKYDTLYLGTVVYHLGLVLIPLADTAHHTLLLTDTIRTTCPGLENCPPPPTLYPTFSPQGDQVAFIHRSRGVSQAWAMRVDGAESRPLSPGPDDGGPLTWSSDGQWVIAQRRNATIIALRSDGADSQRLFEVPAGFSAHAWLSH